MNRVYLPTADQFDTTLSNLSQIANALGTKITPSGSDWSKIAQAVRAGVAPSLYPIGTTLYATHSVYGTMGFYVVAHDYLKSARDDSAHTMTIMSKELLAPLQYDKAEAFYYANNDLPAGTYNFTISNAYLSWAVGTYQFTLTESIPAGGQLSISGNATAELTSLDVISYEARIDEGGIEGVPITLGSDGTSLGTFGNELNHIHRVSYGSNNYKESALRQYLNGEGKKNSVWNPQTKFDRPPSWNSTVPGFANGFGTDFLPFVGKVVLPCSANTTYEAPDSTTNKGAKYTLNDKFYLPSQKELFGDSSGTPEDGSVQFPFYNGADTIDFIKYRDNVETMWRTRTPNPWPAHDTRVVNTSGVSTANAAVSSIAFSVACTIV